MHARKIAAGLGVMLFAAVAAAQEQRSGYGPFINTAVA
jgi:hypothetical protein